VIKTKNFMKKAYLYILLFFAFFNSNAQVKNSYSISILPSLNKDYSFGKNMFDTQRGTKTVIGYELGYHHTLNNNLSLSTGLGYINSGFKTYSQPIDNGQGKEVFYSEYNTPSVYLPIRLGYQYKFIEVRLGTNLRYDFKTRVYKSRIGAYYTEGEGGILEERFAMGFDFAVLGALIKKANSKVQIGPFVNTISFTSNNNIVTYGLALKYSLSRKE